MPLLALLLAAGLAPVTTDALELTNIRPTYGEFGPTRPDWKVPLADILPIAFDIQGLQPDATGLVRFRTTLEVENAKGQSIYKPDPLLTAIRNVQGSGKVRHGVVVVTGLDQDPGTYKLKVTVQEVKDDRNTKDATRDSRREASFTREFTLLPVELSIVRFQMAYDRLGQMPAPCAGGVGQTLFATLVVLGYKPDAKENQAAVSVEMTILDDQDRPTFDQPNLLQFKNIPAANNHLPIRFILPLHRAGQFRIILKLTDQVAKKSTTLSVPLVVVEPK